MSEVENKPVVADPVEPTVADAAVEPLASTTATDVEAAKPEVEAPAATEAAPAAAAAEETKEEKTIEPVSEGQLSHKGPGLVKSLIPSKKEFWLSDDAVAPENLSLYLRGEKPEIAHPVVAWASQTGKGLLFSTKKNADRAHPTEIFALYDATDLKKQSPHEFAFKLNGHNHTFKAANDVERDGWYLSIEKSIELGKASKEEITGSESYKAEAEKLAKPAAAGAAAGAAAASKPAEGEETADKDAKKTRTKSPFARFSRKKEEAAEKKEEEPKEDKTEEATPALESTEQAPIAEAVAAAEIPAAAEAAEKKDEEVAPTEEKPKVAKRQSIFGKLMSPSREKGAKEAELKEPTKDAVVSENPPVLPETTTEAPAETALPAVTEPATEAPKETEAASPTKEKTNFLSSFMKRNRSVSPSTALNKEAAKTEEPAAAATPAEEVKTEEPAAAQPEEEAAAPTETPAEEKSTVNKRQSVLGSLGRRASKALNRMQAPKKEAPAATEAKEETGTALKEDNAVVNGTAPEVTPETKPEEEDKKIGDVVPEAVNVGSAQPVTASA